MADTIPSPDTSPLPGQTPSEKHGIFGILGKLGGKKEEAPQESSASIPQPPASEPATPEAQSDFASRLSQSSSEPPMSPVAETPSMDGAGVSAGPNFNSFDSKGVTGQDNTAVEGLQGVQTSPNVADVLSSEPTSSEVASPSGINMNSAPEAVAPQAPDVTPDLGGAIEPKVPDEPDQAGGNNTSSSEKNAYSELVMSLLKEANVGLESASGKVKDAMEEMNKSVAKSTDASTNPPAAPKEPEPVGA